MSVETQKSLRIDEDLPEIPQVDLVTEYEARKDELERLDSLLVKHLSDLIDETDPGGQFS